MGRREQQPFRHFGLDSMVGGEDDESLTPLPRGNVQPSEISIFTTPDAQFLDLEFDMPGPMQPTEHERALADVDRDLAEVWTDHGLPYVVDYLTIGAEIDLDHIKALEYIDDVKKDLFAQRFVESSSDADTARMQYPPGGELYT